MSEVKDLGRDTVLTIKPYVPGKPIEEVESQLGITGVIKLASNENPLGASPLAIEALRGVLDSVHHYPDSNCYYLKQELAAQLGCRNENLIIGNGSDELLKLIAETFLNPGDEVIYAQPSFSEYEFVSRIMDANTIAVPLKPDFSHDLEAMAQRIGPRTKLIFICNPNNPTGTIVKQQELVSFMEKVPPSTLVVIDEAYQEYVTDPSFPQTLDYLGDSKKKAIILRTFSKIHGLAGLRIGYGISSPEIISLVHLVREPFNVNLPAQEAARASIRDQAHLQRSKEMVLTGRDYLYRVFDQLGLKYIPTQANFIFLDIEQDSREVFNALLKEGVIVRTGDIFGYPSFIRVTIGTPEENKRFVVCLCKVLGR